MPRTLRARSRPSTLFVECLETRATPAILTVNSLLDNTTAADGLVTLREAVRAANNDTATDGGGTGSGADTIVFAESLNGNTITLNGSQLPTLSEGLTIRGPGANLLTIDANDGSRILNIAAGVTAEVSGLTLRRGNTDNDGGAINNNGTLTIRNCVLTKNFSANEAGALSNFGTMNLINSVVTANVATNNGGGIRNTGFMEIVGSTIAENTANGGYGGGISNTMGGTLNVSNTTIMGNSADNNGGGVRSTSMVTLTNCTISANTVKDNGGGLRNFGNMIVTNCTVVLNRADSDGNADGEGGGISAAPMATTTLVNLIIAGNLLGTGNTPNDVTLDPNLTTSRFNLIGDPASAGGLTGSNGNILGDGAGNLLPLSQILNTTLANNGGLTLTHALVPGSAALNAGDPSITTADQRGLPVNGIRDIGAFENQAITISPATFPTGLVGVAYSQIVSASGATGPFTFQVSANTLPGGLGLSSSGTLNGTPTTAGTSTFTILATAASGDFGTESRSITINTPPIISPLPVPIPGIPPNIAKQFAVGGDVGSGTVKLFATNGTERLTLTPFGADFTGGIRTATGDFNRDGVDDIVVGTGPGRPTRVLVLDGVTQAQLFAIDPFEAAFTGGVFVAAGDLNGDGRADLIITPDQGGGPRARIFSGDGFGQIADFFGIDDAAFRGGARAAVGDINNDGRVDLIVAAGFGGGPRVAAFNGMLLTSGGGPKLFSDFFAFEITLRDGIFVTAGDINGDGFAELIAGGGPGGAPRVSAFDGKSLVAETQTRISDFFAGDTSNRGGVRVASKDLNNDGIADLIAGAGTGAGTRVTTYSGVTLGASAPVELSSFEAFPGLTNGVFVG